jgi:hypothetical protein
MINSICNWCSEYLTYTNIRNVAELFYFIVLTGAMVYYAAKSYKKSVEAKPDIITHIYILIIRIGWRKVKAVIHCIWKFTIMAQVQRKI